MDAIERKSALKRRGHSGASIAREINVGVAAVGQVINGTSRSARIEALLSERLGLPPAQIWPEWYGGVALESAPAHAAIDPQLLGEMRAMMRIVGLERGCTLAYAIPRLRHVVLCYNQLISRMNGNDSAHAMNALMRGIAATHARTLADPEDASLFERNWWEPLEAFAHATSAVQGTQERNSNKKKS